MLLEYLEELHSSDRPNGLQSLKYLQPDPLQKKSQFLMYDEKLLKDLSMREIRSILIFMNSAEDLF